MSAQEPIAPHVELVGTAITSCGSTEGSPTRVPASRYTCPDFAAAEHAKVWPRVWQLACSLDHVSQPGDYYEYRVGWLSALIVRGRDGVLRAFQNACRHRGNVLCSGTGQGLRNLRCPYHGWTYDLRGALKGVPSHRGFGEMDREALGLTPVQVDTWGPLVFVNFDLEAMTLADYLEECPKDSAALEMESFRCSAAVLTKAPANWKLVADGFSETYHVQTLHAEMLGSIDDIDAPQQIWGHTGVSKQRYGVPSPRLRGADDQQVWDSFIVTQGGRMGIETPCPVPPIPDGQTLQDVIAQRIRAFQAARGADLSGFDTNQILELCQYNLFPNTTVLVSADILQILSARPGPTPDEAELWAFAFERAPSADAPHNRPMDLELDMAQTDFGFVLNQDVEVLRNAQRGVHQPGFTHLNLSSEEARIINLHRNLERYLEIEPSELLGGPR